MNSSDDIYLSLLSKINETEELIVTCKNLPNIPGKQKLQKRFESELKFLRKLSKSPEKLKEEHIRSSNIYHLSAIVHSCSELQGVTKILSTFSYVLEENEVEYDVPLVVDVVADYGKTWVKVVTRNPHYLYQSCMGHGKYGRRSIVEQVREMLECASQNLHMFQPPKIIVRLAAGVTQELKDLLLELDVQVVGEVVTPDSDNPTSSDLCSEQQHQNEEDLLCKLSDPLQTVRLPCNVSDPEVNVVQGCFNLKSVPQDAVLNLDVSTFLAYVSNMTNGHCNEVYNEKLLMELAEMERVTHVKPILDELFEGRKLVCCDTAHRDFLEILSTVGGESEKLRAWEFLKRVTIVPDDPSEDALLLDRTSRIKERSKVVFGTGDSLKAVTVSANLGFLRAAESQGIKFMCFIHESRALTECKELKQDQINKKCVT